MELVSSTPTLRSVESLTDSYVCPKCQATNRADAQSCQSCGILFSRFYAQIEDRFEADFRLAGLTRYIDLWQAVLADYENLDVHKQFVEECASAELLEFAAYRYRILNEVINDDIADSQLKQIAALAQFQFETGASSGRSFQMPRYHLWFFVLAGLFLGIGVLGGQSFRPLGLGALIFLGGLWAFRLASDYEY